MKLWTSSTRWIAFVAGVALLGAIALSAVSCRSPIPNRFPVGESFPAVLGESLEGKPVPVPIANEPAILLIGYVQDAQFDADRWLYGLLQARIPVRVIELPTLPGIFVRAIGGMIDEGMRSGIPKEDWASVVTVYGPKASDIVAFTGNTNPRNMRVVLLDAQGKVRWFHDRGFSAGKLIELEAAAKALLTK